MNADASPRAFSAVERMLALRYLRARGKDSVISAIAIFSFIGVMLGVATLIIVMSVMGGFRKELYAKFLGFNGHVLVYPIESGLTDYKDVVARLVKVPGVVSAKGFIEGQALVALPQHDDPVRQRPHHPGGFPLPPSPPAVRHDGRGDGRGHRPAAM